MSDDLRTRIAAHRSWGDGFCECGFEYADNALVWADHVIAELGLTAEHDRTGGPMGWMTDSVRYVTDWRAE